MAMSCPDDPSRKDVQGVQWAEYLQLWAPSGVCSADKTVLLNTLPVWWQLTSVTEWGEGIKVWSFGPKWGCWQATFFPELSTRGPQICWACLEIRLISLPNPVSASFFHRSWSLINTLPPTIHSGSASGGPVAASLSIVFPSTFPEAVERGYLVTSNNWISNLHIILNMHKTFICNFLFHILLTNRGVRYTSYWQKANTLVMGLCHLPKGNRGI